MHAAFHRRHVHAFTPPPPVRHAKLMPMRDGTIELRQKGQSFRLIRELLATVGVAVGAAIFAWFLAELSHNSASALQRQRFARGRTPVQNTIRVQSAAVSPATVAMTGNSPLMLPPILRLSQMSRKRLNDRVFAVCESRMLATADQTSSTRTNKSTSTRLARCV